MRSPQAARQIRVIPHLERLGLRQGFQFISCAENGCPPKPEPDVYLRALKSLAVSPQEALAIEDSPNGVIATQRAGIKCIDCAESAYLEVVLSRWAADG